jgi:hypothetical protein
LQLEDVSNQLFNVKADIVDDISEHRSFGQRQHPKKKMLKGFGMAFGLLLLIWFPLLAMSLLNSASIGNPVQLASFQFSLGAFQPLFISQNNDVQQAAITAKQYELLQKMDETGFMSAFGPGDIQRFIFSSQSISEWGISNGSFSILYNALVNNSITVSGGTFLTFTRQELAAVATISQVGTVVDLSNGTQNSIAQSMNISKGSSTEIAFAFPVFIHLTENAYPGSLPAAFVDQYANISIKQLGSPGNTWWVANQTSPYVVCALIPLILL